MNLIKNLLKIFLTFNLLIIAAYANNELPYEIYQWPESDTLIPRERVKFLDRISGKHLVPGFKLNKKSKVEVENPLKFVYKSQYDTNCYRVNVLPHFVALKYKNTGKLATTKDGKHHIVAVVFSETADSLFPINCNDGDEVTFQMAFFPLPSDDQVHRGTPSVLDQAAKAYSIAIEKETGRIINGVQATIDRKYILFFPQAPSKN